MPSFMVEAPHNLGADVAAERIKPLLEQMLKQFAEHLNDVQGGWNGNTLNFSFTTYGFAIKGDMQALESVVRVQGSLPIAVLPFRGTIEQRVRDELLRALRHAGG